MVMLTNKFTLAKNAVVVPLLVMSAQLLTAPTAMAEGGSGILPVLEYTGDFSKRSYLLGDFDGKRTEWANNGVSFDIDYHQYFQGVTDGGRDEDSEYRGSLNYNVNLDFDRMGLIPGGLLTIRARSRYGKSINGISGSLIPANTDATYLTASSPDENITLWVPVFNYTQFLSETFAVGFGKYDTLDSPNEFASGAGRTQYWNQNLNTALSPVMGAPNVTTGAVALYMPSPNLTITGMVGTNTDTSNSSGLNDFDEGLFAMTIVSYQYQLDGLPGGIAVIPGFAWDRDYTNLNDNLTNNDGFIEANTENDTWFFSSSVWQYLWTKEEASQPIDFNDGRQDLQGVGMFFRAQAADTDTSPLDYSFSGGLSAKGIIPGRENDAMGFGYAYYSLSKVNLIESLGLQDSWSAWELFYNIELTPAIHVMLDAQVVNSSFPAIDTATILGVSLELNL